MDHYLPPVDRRLVGGNAVNVGVTLQRWGIDAAYAGAVGSDENGRWVIEALQSEGVDTRWVRVVPGMTALTDIQVGQGERTFLREELGVLKDFHLDQEMLEAAKGYDLVHTTTLGQIQGRFSHLARMAQYLPAFRDAGVLVSFDYSAHRLQSLFAKTLPFVDLAFLSRSNVSAEEAVAIAGQVVLGGPRVAVVTMGVKGSVAWDGTRAWYQPAVPVADVVDTTGAGDAFIGTFLAGWLQGEPIDRIMKRAAAYAAESCTSYGAWTPSGSEGRE